MTERLFLFLLVLLTLATSTGRAEAEDVPLYQVEVMVFTTGALKGWTEEYWPWPEALRSTRLEEEIDNRPALQNIPPVSTPVLLSNSNALLLDDLYARHFPPGAPSWLRSVRAVPSGQRLLESAQQRLTPKKGYRIVAFYSWIQPAIRKTQARTFEIVGDTPYGDILDGQVRFYKNRYAHIDLTLKMTRRIPQKIRADFARHEGLAPEELPESWTFHLSETRKIKSNEWHYFDHPLIGALAVIRRISSK